MQKRILLIIAGGIAAYKSLDLIRRLKERGYAVRAILTRGGAEFITPLSVGSLCGERAFTDMFSLTDEADIGHIALSRQADLLVVAPATADILAKMAQGHADDLASTALLATDKPILVAPAMNPRMWEHPATRRNMAQLLADGVRVVGPNSGRMAERGEEGPGRMAEPLEIVAAIEQALEGTAGRSDAKRALAGRRVVITSGPTHEPIDPVRYIANRSSGRQGHAIAAAAAAQGAEVILVSGPVSIPDPAGVTVHHVETAVEMLEAVEAALPADVGIFTAAVADWRVAGEALQKMKKTGTAPKLALVENPDILATVAHRRVNRPRLVVGFAAETENVVAYAQAKRQRKGCDWIIANDVSHATGIMGGENNTVHVVTADAVEDWPDLPKTEVAARLVERIARVFQENNV
ncbi:MULTISPECIES: bifunctional phosphopantothenoylcysteine decarboxylase/phosphopantothenate--cysteine ligase CoaBC [unclassified Chelatococcus]|uniref:bifunctional phosphopantothenoylcysteine decarboxylase/phosphopantothenate--cysteine ligase CoaBC n=1 Tax=unclassified Chelatococcus TaxID=2638111 RepID=UPI001BCDD2D8|nr:MULTISPECIES: bifunctional phosphopantothenoylcysteine decarboxylase/phosphopantothenate--cysteine ligase CoaBC [unclassified Chelatococcus]MBS7697074.1 bifunctional phosphopantothenoylcysteine decarboxylase/phosphopantothenate--cysteine ligase CoaBC [Chelatococcus sp. YT9]MBX3556064.1 bifunctional phosphopantothenoylcysteine decarboxylase/phosphopantothenate--cysteine ligase CoaBC [Chelatococcus sp.]